VIYLHNTIHKYLYDTSHNAILQLQLRSEKPGVELHPRLEYYSR